MTQDDQNKPEDEISLIDLFVVVLRHRYLIIASTAIALVLALAYGLILPLFGLAPSTRYTIRALVTPIQIPGSLKDELGIDPLALTQNYALDLVATTDALGRFKVLDKALDADMEPWEQRSLIAESFMGKAYKVQADVDGISFRVDTLDAEAGKAFLADRIAMVEKLLRDELTQRSNQLVQSLLVTYQDSTTPAGISEPTKQLIISSQHFASGLQSSLTIISQPDVVRGSKTRDAIKTGTIMVLSFFFLSIFLSFILEALENIKGQPDSMGKIRLALRKEKTTGTP